MSSWKYGDEITVDLIRHLDSLGHTDLKYYGDDEGYLRIKLAEILIPNGDLNISPSMVDSKKYYSGRLEHFLTCDSTGVIGITFIGDKRPIEGVNLKISFTKTTNVLAIASNTLVPIIYKGLYITSKKLKYMEETGKIRIDKSICNAFYYHNASKFQYMAPKLIPGV